MRRYEIRTVTVEQEEYAGTVCDGCGYDGPYLISVVIEVNYGEEMGSRDEYDYCDNCLEARADALVAAGSRAELVTGADEGNPDDD